MIKGKNRFYRPFGRLIRTESRQGVLFNGGHGMKKRKVETFLLLPLKLGDGLASVLFGKAKVAPTTPVVKLLGLSFTLHCVSAAIGVKISYVTVFTPPKKCMYVFVMQVHFLFP